MTCREGQERVQKGPKMKALRMKFSILENVPTPQESILKLCTASQRPYMAKSQKYRKHIKSIYLYKFPYFSSLELFPISKICGSVSYRIVGNIRVNIGNLQVSTGILPLELSHRHDYRKPLL